VPEGEETEQGIENLFGEIMTENSPAIRKKKLTQVQEAQSPKQDEPKKTNTKTHHN
jgi:hypothetical protein